MTGGPTPNFVTRRPSANTRPLAVHLFVTTVLSRLRRRAMNTTSHADRKVASIKQFGLTRPGAAP